jgi:hypothetical protein
MTGLRRVFISSPRDEHLDDRRNALKWAIVNEIAALGYEPQVFGSRDGGRGLASGRSWSAAAADEVMQHCIGAAILGFPIWQCSGLESNQSIRLVTEYCHYEGAIARTYGLPILAVLEEGVEARVLFNRYAGDPYIEVPAKAEPTWARERDFRAFLHTWNEQISKRRDVFLAYSGKQAGRARSVSKVLTRLGATILDWKEFSGGSTILQQIEDAASRTSGGVFLFTRDDLLEGEGQLAAPRDNVIFEAGFFARAKGHQRVLIIREAGAKMPADLGGVIYESLGERGNVRDLEDRLRVFLEASIWSARAEPSAAEH